jgi:nucleoside-diphosphate-sugar epimerase
MDLQVKRVAICGATGFIGRNLAERFARDPNYQVTAVFNRKPPFDLAGVKWIQANLTRQEDVLRVLTGQDVILQAAAMTSGIHTTFSKPSQVIVDNAVMNSYIFAAAHELNAQQVVFPSCTIMLGSSAAPQRESDYDPSIPPLPVYEGPAYTKLYLEHLAQFYARVGRTKFTVFRHSNVYGPHDKFDLKTSHVFGATITKVLSAADSRIEVWGTGEEGRDLLHIDDLVEAFVAAVERQTEKFSLYNIGSGDQIAISDLVRKVIDLAGRDLRICYDETKPTIKTSVSLDCTKAKAELGWQPKIGIDEGIRRTLAWWREARPVG